VIRNKFVYAGLGLLLGLLFAIFGFWRTLLVIVLGVAGFVVGTYMERQ
jgi:uncharacterized membrane protein